MKNTFLFLILVFTISSCIEKDLNYTLPYTPMPVAIGFLDSVNGARIFVGKNANILTKDSSIVKDAKVSLWSDDGLVENLSFLSNNVFVSSPNFKAKPNKNYFFKASTPLSIDTLISSKVNLPTIVPILNVRYKYTNQQQNQLNLYVDIKDPDGFNAYTFYVQRYNKDTLYDAEMIQNPVFVPNKSIIYSDREFQGNTHTFVLEYINTDTYIGRRNVTFDTYKITIFSISKPTYDLFLSLNTSEPTVGDPFFEPNVISNQVKNGLGVFGVYSSASFTLKL
jgi:hypothetical protein